MRKLEVDLSTFQESDEIKWIIVVPVKDLSALRCQYTCQYLLAVKVFGSRPVFSTSESLHTYWKVHSGTRKLHSSSVVLPNNTESPSLSRPVEWGIKMLQVPTPSSWRESTFLTGLLVEEAVLPG